jgi:hypothetical protein
MSSEKVAAAVDINAVCLEFIAPVQTVVDALWRGSARHDGHLEIGEVILGESEDRAVETV